MCIAGKYKRLENVSIDKLKAKTVENYKTSLDYWNSLKKGVPKKIV